jgi:pilus assembly protein CpaD
MRTLSTLALAALLLPAGLAGCASSLPATQTALANGKVDNPALPTEQYPLRAQSRVRTLNLRVNPNGLSDNQRLALGQLAQNVSWTSGEPADIEIVTAGDPRAVNAGRAVGDFLVAHDVDASDLSQASRQDQPADIVSVNVTEYRARAYDCNQSWENLSRTADNKPYNNFGCAINSNLAAMIADPRDLAHPQDATPPDAARKSVILDKYRKGDVTSSAQDDQSKGSISNAIQ